MSVARRTAEAYVRAVNTRDLDGMLRLFRDDAVLHHPIGEFVGREALEGFYRDIVMQFATALTTRAILAEGTMAVAELVGASPMGEGRQCAVDVFRVDDTGRIRELAIYYRNENLAPTGA